MRKTKEEVLQFAKENNASYSIGLLSADNRHIIEAILYRNSELLIDSIKEIYEEVDTAIYIFNNRRAFSDTQTDYLSYGIFKDIDLLYLLQDVCNHLNIPYTINFDEICKFVELTDK